MATGQRGTVLIVAPDAAVVRLRQERLENAGYGVTSAATAEAALEVLRPGGVDLLLLDEQLSGDLEGPALYERLKAAGIAVPVLLMTGFSNENLVLQALHAGVRDFLPSAAAALDYLPAAVDHAIQQARSGRQLAEFQVRFEAFMNNGPAVAFMKDEQGRLVFLNKALERQFGVREADWLGRTDFELFSEEIAQELMAHDRTVLATGKAMEFHEIVPLPSGERRQWLVWKFPFEDAAGRRFLGGIALDVTQQQRAELKIREQAALLDNANDAICVRDLHGRILFWNRGAERLYGWTAAEAIGRPVHELFFKEPVPELTQAQRATLEGGEWMGDLPQVTRAGAPILVESRWTLVRDAGGWPRSILMINTDITQKKRLEAQYLRAQRLESLGTLAGGIAHDLNNVLTPILMGTHLLQLQPPAQEQQAIMATMAASAERGAEMVKSILAFARGAEGQRVPLRLEPIVKEIIKMLERTLAKSIELHMMVADDLWSVTGDGTQLYQMLMNLCVNARDAMPDGGRLAITADNKLLDESYAFMHAEAQAGPYVCLSVTDTGMGIPAALLDKIFDPFFTTKEPGKGTGLGLFTVMGIVKSHKGFVNVYSQTGKGAEFAVYLPAIESSLTRLAEDELRALPRGHGEWILVVDDEAGIRQVTQHTLESHGYRVLTAADGAEAVALFAQRMGQVHVVLTDLMMPIMDGSATIRALLRLDPNVKIIAASGLSPGRKTLEMALAGVQAFLPKPYAADVLLRTIDEILQARAPGPTVI